MRKQQEKYWLLLSTATALGLPPRDSANAEMFEHAEWEVGFDIIVVQLYEFDIRITESFFQQAEAVAREINLPPESYNFLRPLVQPFCHA